MTEVEKTLTVVYIEPIGTGQSGRLENSASYTYHRYARQVEGVADHLELERIILIGHSSGGFVAQRFALQYPQRLSSLVLYDTSAVVNDEYYGDVNANVQAFPAQHPGHDTAVADAMDAWVGQSQVTDDAGFTAIAQRVLPLYFRDYWAQEQRLDPFRAQVRGWIAPQRAGESVDYLAKLSTVTQPVLIIVGRHDFICGPRWATMLQDALPDSKLVILEDSGHFGHIESPDEFGRAITDFVLAQS
jgi:proline iminopeptidase